VSAARNYGWAADRAGASQRCVRGERQRAGARRRAAGICNDERSRVDVGISAIGAAGGEGQGASARQCDTMVGAPITHGAQRERARSRSVIADV
jgi:hypothetical protein